MLKDDKSKTPQERVQAFANLLQEALIKKHGNGTVSVQSNGFELTATLGANGLSDSYVFDLEGNFMRYFNGA
jgi:hypothetical protein